MNHFFKKNQKKGNALILAIVFVVIAGLLFLLTLVGTNHLLLSEVNDLVQDSDFAQVAKDSSQDLTSRNNLAWDNAFVLLSGGILVGLFFAGFTIQRSPVVLLFTFVIIFVAVYSGFHIVNVYEDLADNTQEDIDFQANFPKSHLVMSNLLIYIVVGVVVLGLGIFIGNRVEI
jgi:hypothetical protein